MFTICPSGTISHHRMSFYDPPLSSPLPSISAHIVSTSFSSRSSSKRASPPTFSFRLQCSWRMASMRLILRRSSVIRCSLLFVSFSRSAVCGSPRIISLVPRTQSPVVLPVNRSHFASRLSDSRNQSAIASPLPLAKQASANRNKQIITAATADSSAGFSFSNWIVGQRFVKC